MAKGIEAANISRCYCCNWYQAEWKKCLLKEHSRVRDPLIIHHSVFLDGGRKKNNCRIIITRCCCWNNVMNSANQTRLFLSKKNTSMESTLKEWYRHGRCNFSNLSKTCFFFIRIQTFIDDELNKRLPKICGYHQYWLTDASIEWLQTTKCLTHSFELLATSNLVNFIHKSILSCNIRL